VHGLKWLQGGSGFGQAKNSGWRNSQSGGISEQFTLHMPVFADYNQRGNQVDYAYTFNGSVDGWVTGTWGILRSYKGGQTNDLFELPNNPVPSGIRLTNAKDFDKVCPKTAPDRDIDLTAVSVNDIFGARSDIVIQDLYANAHVGASPDTQGGTLVYNSRGAAVELGEDSAHAELGVTQAFGPLHDPTGIIYVNTEDLVSAMGDASTKDNDPYCWRAPTKGNKYKYDPSLPSCKVNRPTRTLLRTVITTRRAATTCCTRRTANRLTRTSVARGRSMCFPRIPITTVLATRCQSTMSALTRPMTLRRVMRFPRLFVATRDNQVIQLLVQTRPA
jgi:hypothetical protein